MSSISDERVAELIGIYEHKHAMSNLGMQCALDTADALRELQRLRDDYEKLEAKYDWLCNERLERGERE